MHVLAIVFALLTGVLTADESENLRSVSAVSPDRRNVLVLEVKNGLSYSVLRDGRRVIGPSPISLSLSDGRILGGKSARPIRVESRRRAGKLETPIYKKASVVDNGDEKAVFFDGGWCVALHARDDGVAYRFETSFGGCVTVMNEEAPIVFPEAETLCYAGLAELSLASSWESAYVKTNLCLLPSDKAVYLPFAAFSEGSTVVVTESDLLDYPGWNLRRTDSRQLSSWMAKVPATTENWDWNLGVTEFPTRKKRVTATRPHLAVTDGTRTYPWRVFILADSPLKAMESDIVYALATPCRLKGPRDWITPGLAVWDWWNDWNVSGSPPDFRPVDFRAGCNTKTYEYYIDFASKFGVPYVILDEGWSRRLEIMEVSESIDLAHLVAYARKRNVSLILWAAWAQLDGRQREVFAHYSKLGIKGFKIDFMDRDDQTMVRFLTETAEIAAEHRLVLDYHGMYKPTGFSRTYPNVLNYEGVRGLETCKSTFDTEFPANDLKSLFVRMAAGPMDYTPGAMINSQKEMFFSVGERPGSQGTRVHQLAMMILCEAPLQMLCDSPTQYLWNRPCIDFMAKTPTVWDEMRPVAGEIDRSCALARRKGDTWHLAAVANWCGADFSVRLDFLGEGCWDAEIFEDGPNADRDATDYVRRIRTVRRNETLQLKLAPGGGFAARFTKNVIGNAALPPVERLPTPSGKAMRLVENGKANFCIVGRFKAEQAVRGPEGQSLARDARDSAGRAAWALKEAFKRTAGLSIDSFEEGDRRTADYPYVIAVGETDIAAKLGMKPRELPREGFEVRTFPGGVAIAGMDGFSIPGTFDRFSWRSSRLTCNGTEMGARDFIERFLGVRRYAHYDKGLWEDWPELRDLTVEPCAYRDHPRLSLRGNNARHWRLAEATDIFCSEDPNPFKLAKAHPDKLETIFYRDRAGRLYQDDKTYGNNYFDVSNPAFADVLVGDWKDYYRQDGTNTYWGSLWAPSSRCLWFGQVDAHVAMDNERTRPFVDPNAKGNMSDVYANFHRYLATRVKEELPGKRLVVFAYMNYLQLPKIVKDFPDNLQVLACCGSPLFVTCPAYVDFAHEIFRGWGKLTKFKPAVYTYDAGFAPDAVIVQTLRGYYEGEFYRTFWNELDHEFAFLCLSDEAEAGYPWTTYLTYQAMWNPETNPDAILTEFFVRMFGAKAALHAKAFFDLLKDRWENHYAKTATASVRGSIPSPDYKILYTKTYPEDVVRRLLAHLDAAEREIAPNTPAAERFAKFAGAYRKVLPDIISYQHLSFPEVSLVKGVRTKLPSFQRAFAGGPLRSRAPTAFLTWTETGLLLEAELEAETLVAEGDMWKQDSIEFLLAPGEKPVNLYQFVCAAGGDYEDLYKQIDPPRALDINWRSPQTKYERTIDGNRWMMSLFVPWTDLKEGRMPQEGETWKFNLISNRAKPADYQSVSATLNNNRNLGYYGKLHFVEKGNQ